jgi:hypothetical protein
MHDALALVLSVIVLSWTNAQQAVSQDALPAAESILDRYIEATGGAAAYESRTSETLTGTFELAAAGVTGPLRMILEPGLQRSTIELPRIGRIEQGVKDGVAWANDPLAGPRILEGFEAEFAIVNAHPGRAARWREQYKAVETAGIADVNGESAYRVVHTLAKGGSLTAFYSVASGLLLKVEYSTARGPLAQFMEEYSDLGGILTPTRVVTTTRGQRVSVLRLESVEANVEIPDERFDLPEAVRALLK